VYVYRSRTRTPIRTRGGEPTQEEAQQACDSGEQVLPRDGQKNTSVVSDQRHVGRGFMIGCLRYEQPTVRGLSDQWTSKLNLGLWA
jgi:hypothetical protein